MNVFNMVNSSNKKSTCGCTKRHSSSVIERKIHSSKAITTQNVLTILPWLDPDPSV